MKTNAELNLPEFDVLLSSDSFEEAVKQYPNVSCDSWKREFAHSYWQQGARWQFQECAKIIAARDAEIAKLKECLELWTQRNSNLQEKIRELEKANADCISLFLHEERMKAQAAELKLLKDLDSQRQAIVMSAGVKIENLQAERDIYLKALEKIHSNGHTQACIYANEDDDIYVCDCHIDAVDTAFAIIEGKKLR